jgi:hypothetical protein
MTLSDNPSPDGKMQIYCQICKNNVPLQDSYNISRAIRHLKTKHPDVMPEHGGEKTIDCQDNGKNIL